MAESKKSNRPIGAHLKLCDVEGDYELLDTYTVSNTSPIGSIMYAALNELVWKVDL